MNSYNPTVDVAVAHIHAQGVYAKGSIEALEALFAAPQPLDEEAAERLVILGSEHLQQALNAVCSDTPQTIRLALMMLDAGITAALELRERLEASHG